MIPISARFEKARADLGMKIRDFADKIGRPALLAGASFFFERFRMRHFEPAAFYRYGYSPRSAALQTAKRLLEAASIVPASREAAKYLARTGSGEILRTGLPGFLGVIRGHKGPFRSKAFSWTGQLENYIQNYPVSAFLASARTKVNSKRAEVELRVPIPHPIHPYYGGELARITEDEQRSIGHAIKVEMNRLSAIQGGN